MTDETGQTDEAQAGRPPLGVIPSGWSGGPLVVVFFIALEQPMAVPEGAQLFVTRYAERVEWVKWNGGFNFVGMRIYRPPETLVHRMALGDNAMDVFRRATSYEPPPAPEGVTFGRVPPVTAEVDGTVVEVATPLLPTDDGEPQHAVSNAFDRCLEELRALMRAYFMVTQDVRFRPISRQTCPETVPMATQDVDGHWTGWGFFLVHYGEGQLPFAPEELTKDQYERLRITLERNRKGDPMAPYMERSRVASRAYRIDGDYPTTVIAAYTAGEVLLNGVLLSMAWEEDLPRAETRGWFEGEMGFMSRVGTHVTPRLGGNWGMQKPDNPMSRLKRLADLRHMAVHYGYLPEEKEAQEALVALDTLEPFVKARLGAKRKRYPRTALFVLGMPGLRRLGLWDNWMEHFLDTHSEQEPDWLATFHSWLLSP